MTSEGDNPLLTEDRRQQWGLMNFQLCNKSLKDWSLWKQLILFPSNLNVTLGSVLGNGDMEILGKQN